MASAILLAVTLDPGDLAAQLTRCSLFFLREGFAGDLISMAGGLDEKGSARLRTIVDDALQSLEGPRRGLTMRLFREDSQMDSMVVKFD